MKIFYKIFLASIFLLCIHLISNAQWIQQPSGTSVTLTEISFANSTTGNICGLNGTILRTSNNGLNWINQPNTSGGANLWSVFMMSSSSGVCIGDNTIIITSNSGTNWILTAAPVNELWRGIHFYNPTNGCIVGRNGKIITTTNGGINWTEQTSGTTEWLWDVSFPSVNTGYAVGANGKVIKTTNGGINWNPLTISMTQTLYGVYFISDDTGYSVGDGGKIFKTINGTDWTLQTSGVTASLNDVAFINATTGSVTGLNNTILRTSNGGNNWITQLTGLPSQNYYGVALTGTNEITVTASNGVILHSTTGGFSPPFAPNLVSPVNGAFNIPINPLLDWDSVTIADSYHIQVATDSLFTSPTLDTSGIILTRLQLPPARLQNNVQYFWRVQGVNFLGNGIWSSIWRFTTIVAIPSAPNLLLPVYNASNVSLNPSFDWDSTSPATFYRIQISYDSTFNYIDKDETGIPVSNYTLVTPSLRNNTRYYWRVSTTNIAGISSWSSVFRFSTLISTPPPPILSYPTNGATGIPLNVTFDWYDDVSATGYRLQLASDSLFVNILFDTTGLPLSQMTPPAGLLSNFTRYYWRVNTTNGLGTGPYSTVWSFTTILAIPFAPILVSPFNGETNVSLTPTCDWDSVPFAQTYRFQISTDSNFVTTLLDISGLTFSQMNIPGATLTTNTTYYWRVNATNIAGTGNWSIVWHFTTVVSAPIAAPNLLSPPNGATNQSQTPTLDWTDVFNAETYRIQVSTDSFFNTVNFDTVVTPSNLIIPSGKLSGNTRYSWRVRAQNQGGVGPWSVTWNFRTSPIGIRPIGTEIPSTFNLYDNYPNPFNPSTKIRFDVPKYSNVRITVYDLLGRIVEVIIDENLQPGKYEIIYNAIKISSGIYFYSIECPEYHSAKKMLLLK